MLEHLSKTADDAVRLARTIAREAGQEHIGTEHLLLALARSGAGAAGRFLRARKLDEAAIAARLREIIHERMEETWVFGRLPGTPALKGVMVQAIADAQAAGRKVIATSDLLLAMVAEPRCLAQQVLLGLGVNADQARSAVGGQADEA